MNAVLRPLLALLTFGSICSGGPENNSADLLPPLPPVADEDNGWLLLNKLPQANTTPLDRKRRNEMLIYPSEGTDGKIDRACVAELLTKHSDLNAVTRQMMARPQFQVIPGKEKLFEPWISPNASRLSLGLRTVLAQALMTAQDGNPAQAWTDIEAAAKLSARVGSARGNIVYLASGMVFLQKCAEAASWAGRYVKDPAMLRQWARALLPFEDHRKPFEECIRGEYAMLQRLDALFGTGGEDMKRALVNLYLSERSETASGGATGANFDALMKDPPQEVQFYLGYAAATNWEEVKRVREQYFRSAPKLDFDTMEKFRLALPPVPAGLGPSVRHHIETDRNTRETACSIVLQTTARVRLARLSLLLRAWSLEHSGQLPDKLDQLAPGDLPGVPVDPFDGKAVRFDKSRQVLWSVDKDLTDEGGRKNSNTDIVQPM